MNNELLRTIRGYFLQGAAVADIEEKIKTEWPNIDAQAMIRTVLNNFAETGCQSKATLDGFCIDAARDLYRRMLEVGDFAGALAAVKEIARLRQKTAGTAAGESDLDSILSGLEPETTTAPLTAAPKKRCRKNVKS